MGLRGHALGVGARGTHRLLRSRLTVSRNRLLRRCPRPAFPRGCPVAQKPPFTSPHALALAPEPVVTKGTAALIALLARLTGVAGQTETVIANHDPPDPLYDQVPAVLHLRVQTAQPRGRLTIPVAKALNVVVANALDQAALTTAMLQAIERAGRGDRGSPRSAATAQCTRQKRSCSARRAATRSHLRTVPGARPRRSAIRHAQRRGAPAAESSAGTCPASPGLQ